MADANTSLPVRTENAGDIIAKIADSLVPSQQLEVDASGRIKTKITASNGDPLTATGTALDVNIASGSASSGVVDGSAFTYGTTLETPVGAVYNDTGATVVSGKTAALRINAERGLHVNLRKSDGTEIGSAAATGLFVKPTDGTNSQGYTASSEAKVSVTQPLPAGTNLIGNVKISDGTDTALVTATGELNVLATAQPGVDIGDVTINNAAGAAAVNIQDGGNSITVDGTVTANQGTAAATASAWPIKVTDGTSVAAIKAASTAAVAADPSLVVALSPNSPIPAGTANIGKVSIQDSSGTEIDDYNTSAALAAAGTSNHDYTVTALKTLKLSQIVASASGKLKIEIQVETGAATGVFVTKFVLFNSTAEPNIVLPLNEQLSVVAGAKVRVIRTNKDNQSQDVYSTICGHEQT